jgi:hypothetical protein
MDFSQILSMIGKNIDQGHKTIADSQVQSLDRIKMSNPEVQGPKLPEESTPEENAYYNSVTGAVAGSLNPVPPARFGKLMSTVGKAVPEEIAPIGESEFNKRMMDLEYNENGLSKRFRDLFQKHQRSMDFEANKRR